MKACTGFFSSILPGSIKQFHSKPIFQQEVQLNSYWTAAVRGGQKPPLVPADPCHNEGQRETAVTSVDAESQNLNSCFQLAESSARGWPGRSV